MVKATTIVSAALLAATAAMVNAACDNACSGHGYCTYEDKCECYDNWKMGLEEGGDCSDRVCPFDFAFVDTPDKSGRFHKYAECSARGLCDRSTGLCQCFDGFEGKACSRTTCPNDCSGHGRCVTLSELPVGSVYADGHDGDFGDRPLTFGAQSHYWDADKTRGCLCDSTYYGVDCSMRLCPFGTDILDLRYGSLNTQLTLPQKQRIDLVPFNGTAVENSLSGKTFALTFKSRLNETFTTIPLYFPKRTTASEGYFSNTDAEFGKETVTGGNVSTYVTTGDDSDFAVAIESALLALPNEVINGVSVNVSQRFDDQLNEHFYIDVSFTGTSVQGPQNLLQVEVATCETGCTPQLTGIHVQEYVLHTTSGVYRSSSIHTSSVTEVIPADFQSYECGRRGKCDYNTGVCSCFTGYTGEACNLQTALV